MADLIHLVDVLKSTSDRTDDLRTSIDSAVSCLQFSSDYRLTDQIFDTLGLADVIKTKGLSEAKRCKLKDTQTRCIACAIIVNALIFHKCITGAHNHILPINRICGRFVRNRKDATLNAWEQILEINYWPIFKGYLDQVKRIFDQCRNKRFLPAYVAYEGDTRKLLDKKIICDWLDFEEDVFQAVRELAAK